MCIQILSKKKTLSVVRDNRQSSHHIIFLRLKSIEKLVFFARLLGCL